MKKRIGSLLTALSCGAGILLYVPQVPLRSYAKNVVSNNFEISYGGWYEYGEAVSLHAENGLGVNGSKGMKVSGRTSPEDGAASDKRFYLDGGESYDYSVQVMSDSDETFHLWLSYSCDGIENKTELAAKTMKGGTWAELSAKYKAPENAGDITLIITTDSANDFVFDDVSVKAKRTESAVYAADSSLGLKDEFAGYFRVGNTLNGTTVKDSKITNALLKEYNSVTCPNEMKPDYTLVQSTSKGDNVGVTLKSAAAIMDFCVQHKIAMRGHTFVWHAQTPTWFFKKDYNANNGWVDEATMDKRLESYISGMFKAIKEQYPTLNLYAYDVCNECIANTDRLFNVNGAAREPGDDKKESGKSAWVQIYKDNHYVEKAFRIAKKYAPEGCALCYNDYNEYWDGKQNGIYNLCKPLYEKGLLDAIGMQSHVSATATGFGGIDAYVKAMKRFLSIGCDVQITELDVNRKGNEFSEQDQANKYKAIFQAAKEWNDSHKDKNRVTAICMWGMNDSLSWIGASNKPLLYDSNNQPKLAYQAVASLIPESQWGKVTAAEPIEPDANGCYYHDTFENGTDSWESRGGDTITTGGTAYAGSKALVAQNREKSWHGVQKTLDSATFKAGDTYSFSVAASGFGKMMLSLQYKDSSGETKYDHIADGNSDGAYVQLANANYKLPEGSGYILYVETEDGTADFSIDEAIVAKAGTQIDGPKPVNITPGDINSDGKINGFDIALARSGIIKGFTDSSAKKAADVNGDGEVNAADLIQISSFALGRISRFTVVEPPVTTTTIVTTTTTTTTKTTQPKSNFNYSANLQYRANNNYLNQCSQSGKVVKETYTGINGKKSLNVYLPYGYDQNKKYNIFYLMHGGGENENTVFSNDVKMHLILDNMIKNGEIEPMIVVAPTFNGCPSSDGNMGAGTVWNEMRQSIIPFVEKKYSTYANKDTSIESLKTSRYHRAYGGFSMGGGSTWNMLINNLDICAYYMPLSGHCWLGASGIQNAIDKSGFSKREYFVLAATGDQDLAYNNMKNLMPTLQNDNKRFTYTSDFSKGNLYFLVASSSDGVKKTHWWGYVRWYIMDALPYFFHEGQ